ncbi:hypothetical protein LTR48_003810 [Friedmanniomyces endolithicus]|uniref:Enoyl reductase (ER) domain-containing protein n=1 Tax=Rachicladosporium monterosium TaxID=1507873 RepID=A0ABR0L458_9PEZI|nr:hypothetical protein LTR29_013374 [Friedmanniomyces endolithicus]KAK1092708.1 hypothetical protein LTR48_003810 [Friedmanniomyces endolithicus]KAK5143243.1 hypothetical protein LTR32_004592 [Rachicladosporium monterosium]
MPPSTMLAWQYQTTKGGFLANLNLNTVPLPDPKPTQHLVQVLHAALNPVDYKLAEVAFVSRFAIPKPANPGIDFVGRMVAPAAGSNLKPGQMVFGFANPSPLAAGSLREYAVVETTGVVAAPEGVEARALAASGVGASTAYQSIVPYVKPGDHVLINGGSGGVGVYSIQVAKAAGCRVTTTCSTPNVELCRSLGADHVIDYRTQDVLETLKKRGQQFDHVVDNVGSQWDLVWRSHEYTKPGASIAYLGVAPTFDFAWNLLKVLAWPSALGGARRKFANLSVVPVNSELEQLGAWMKDGKIKPVFDSVWPMEKVPEAFRKLKTGRAKGKVVIDVASDSKSPE